MGAVLWSVVLRAVLYRTQTLQPLQGALSVSSDAKRLFDNVVRFSGFPTAVISDRDPRFTDYFWKELCNFLGTRLLMSSAYHPQIDGQMDRNHKTLESRPYAVYCLKIA